MNEIKITIDTNVLINLFDVNADEESALKSCLLLRAIIDSKKDVHVDTQISTASEDDISEDKDIVRQKSFLLRMRSIFQQITPGEFVTQSGEITPKSSNDQILFQELKRILFPALNSSSTSYTNNINDLKHLFSHIKNRRDIYITNDENFLKQDKKNALKALQTQIMSPDEFITYLLSFPDRKAYSYKSAPVRHDYQNSALMGSGEMDFTNNNGLYVIGSGNFIFEIKWGECSHEKMRVYNDPQTIEAIALAEDKKFKEITSDAFYDFTDRCREPRRKKDVLILKNSKGYFALVRILDFKVKDRSDDKNYLKFEYIINPSGDCNFKEQPFDPNPKHEQKKSTEIPL